MDSFLPWVIVGLGTTMLVIACFLYSTVGVWFVVIATALLCNGMIRVSGLDDTFPWMGIPSMALLLIATVMWAREVQRRRNSARSTM